MSNIRGTSEPSLRGEIEYLLGNRQPDFERDCALVATAWTVEALAEELRADPQDIQQELYKLMQEGRVLFRMPRSGERLWKLTDDNHQRWQAFSGDRLRTLRFAY